MEVSQICLAHLPDAHELADMAAMAPHLVLVLGSEPLFRQRGLLDALRQAFPGADLAGCTTAGEICGQGVSNGKLVMTALRFDAPGLTLAVTDLDDMADSRAAGLRLARQLDVPGLHSALVFAQGVRINGSALIDGFKAALPAHVALSGGLAGDGGAFTETLTLSTHGISASQLVAVGFSAPRTRLHHGSFHGWRPFGPARKVTRSQGNMLFELDGQPALDVYKRYLGEHARDLPGSGLLFPFEMLGEDHGAVGLIRTILGTDEAAGGLVLAGDIIEQGYLRLMHASTDSLVEGAHVAAEAAARGQQTGGLALLVSCVGRKLVMGDRVDEEVEVVANVFGKDAVVAGFYSNGEISPGLDGLSCRLHNQTMTITHISELPP